MQRGCKLIKTTVMKRKYLLAYILMMIALSTYLLIKIPLIAVMDTGKWVVLGYMCGMGYLAACIMLWLYFQDTKQ